MRISIFGLGYVGAVISGCFSRDGHSVTGVDTDESKVAVINCGRSPIIEPELEPMIAASVQAGTLRATTNCGEAVLETDISMVCVGTPSQATGGLDLGYVNRVCEEIGAALAKKKGRHLLVVRSTMLPGSVRGTVIPALERGSGLKAGADFGVAINPEFLRESTAVHDFDHPPKTVIGTLLPEDAPVIAALYEKLDAPLICTSLETAEMLKYADNSFHALKVTFANEIGSLCKQRGIDAHEVMSIFCQDRKLNVSTAYLKPGFAFGGSCLPKDLRALNRMAAVDGVETPLLHSLLMSNEVQIQRAVRLITEGGRKRIGVLGFAFKGGTDDLRESPVVTVIEALLGKGYEIRLFDGCVSLLKLVGANRRYLAERIPHISKLIVESIEELLSNSDTILIGNQNEEFFRAIEARGPDKHVIDMTSRGGAVKTGARYERVSG